MTGAAWVNVKGLGQARCVTTGRSAPDKRLAARGQAGIRDACVAPPPAGCAKPTVSRLADGRGGFASPGGEDGRGGFICQPLVQNSGWIS
ncbi:MAG: hypothetical protein RugAbin2_01325 [Rugosibacter sp.]|nr:hypothetical protein [Rugosibacter sp.]